MAFKRTTSGIELMGDCVLIKGLRVPTCIGVHAWEREIRQELILDLTLSWNNRTPAASDKVQDCLDYSAVSDWIMLYLGQSQAQLIETVAEQIALGLLHYFGIAEVSLTVKKPGAVPQAEWVGVELTRTQADL
jgi:dihydroneopterin aldolase